MGCNIPREGMTDALPAIELKELSDPEWERRFQGAILRLSQSPAAGQLRNLVPARISHELFSADASTLRSGATNDRVPPSVNMILAQYFVGLEPAPPEMLFGGVELGSNHLGPMSPIQGVLVSAKVTGQDARGSPLTAPGVVFIPNYLALPTHILPRSKDEVEIVVYFGPQETVGAAYDGSRDALVVDRVRGGGMHNSTGPRAEF